MSPDPFLTLAVCAMYVAAFPVVLVILAAAHVIWQKVTRR